MSVVWLAEHLALGNEVVIKFLNDELAGHPSAAKRIACEAATAARVRSPHVVQVLDHGVWEGKPFIVMELLDGCDLAAHLEAQGALSPTETITVLHQLAKALAQVHAVGIIHRDVKPSNVFLCDVAGEIFVKLLDFGLARRCVSSELSSTASQHCAGTPPYMSPEQIVAGDVDLRSDVWSLGVVAFQCLTGKRPFEGETLGAVTLAIHTLPLPRVTELNRDLPPEIDTWFARACSRPREQRFASTTEAVEAMARALGMNLPARTGIPSNLAVERNRTGSSDSAVIPVEMPRDVRRPRAVRAWIASLALAAATIAAVAGAYCAGTQTNRAPAARNRAAATPPWPMEPIEPPGRAVADEAGPELTLATQWGAPSLAPLSISPSAAPTVSTHTRRPVAASASAGSPPVPQMETHRRPVRRTELPDERH